MAALLLASVAACSGEAGDTAADPPAAPAAPTAPVQPVQPTFGADAAADRPARAMSESDRLLLDMAERACNAVDFPTFFRAYGGSWAVRARYTATTVQYGITGRSRAIPRQEYLDRDLYPIAPMDNDYATAETVRAFEGKPGASWRGLTYVELEFNTAGDNRRRIDWLPGRFEKQMTPPPPGLEEGLGAMVQQTGSGGALLFQPTKTCWELFQDVQNPALRPDAR